MADRGQGALGDFLRLLAGVHQVQQIPQMPLGVRTFENFKFQIELLPGAILRRCHIRLHDLHDVFAGRDNLAARRRWFDL